MIRGYFSSVGARRRPFIDGIFRFPTINDHLEVRLLVDTGADRTILGNIHAERLRAELGIDPTTLPQGQPSTGVGGQVRTRIIDAVLILDTFSTPLTLTILEAPTSILPIPSLLGRDVLSNFALFLEERTNRVLLLQPSEADALNLL